MDEEMLATIVAQEKLNKICIESLGNLSTIDDIRNEINNDEKSKNYMMDIVFANYLLDNYDSGNSEKKGVSNFIFEYSKNKDLLHQVFSNNVGMAKELISNFYKGYSVGTSNHLEDVKDNDIKNNIIELSKIFSIDGYNFNYLSDIARFELIKALKHHQTDSLKKDIDNENSFINLNIALLMRILIGDAYTYMCYNNSDHNFSSIIHMLEENCNDFGQIWNLVKDVEIYNFMAYFIDLARADNYFDIYKEVKNTNPNFLKTLGNINPYYVLDGISDCHRKTYRK